MRRGGLCACICICMHVEWVGGQRKEEYNVSDRRRKSLLRFILDYQAPTWPRNTWHTGAEIPTRDLMASVCVSLWSLTSWTPAASATASDPSTAFFLSIPLFLSQSECLFLLSVTRPQVCSSDIFHTNFLCPSQLAPFIGLLSHHPRKFPVCISLLCFPVHVFFIQNHMY